MAVRISPDNAGGYMIWGAKNCGGEKSKTKINDKEYEYYSEHVCRTNTDNEALDLLDIDAVNASLNSQVWPVPPGNYKYVSIIMCGDGETEADAEANLEYQVGKMSESHATAVCNPFTAYSETGLNIPEGGTIRVQLSYDLNDLFQTALHGPNLDTTYQQGGNDNGCYLTEADPDDGYPYFYCPAFGVNALTPSLAQ